LSTVRAKRNDQILIIEVVKCRAILDIQQWALQQEAP
jgi:hypothetical protein